MADDEELLGGLFGSSGLFSGGGQPPWMNALGALSSIPTRQERLMGRGRGGGYAYQPPDNRVAQAAMLRERQQQAEVDDLMRVQQMYGQALEWSPDDAEESLKHVMHLYQNASEPFKTTTGARAFIGMIPKMREEAVKSRAAKSERAGVEGALGQMDQMGTPDQLMEILVANGVPPEKAIAISKNWESGFFTGTPAPGMGTRERWTGQGTPQRRGINVHQGTGGAPAMSTQFDAQGQPFQTIIPGSTGLQPERPIIQWTGEEGRAPLPPEFGGIQHRPQPPIMPPGLEIAAPDQPINLRRPGMVEPMGDRPIDPGRPVIPGLPGPVGLGPGQATEETITLDMGNGQQLLLPTIVDGQRVTPVQALALYRMGRNDPVGVYGSQEEAQRAAEARSHRIGQVRGMGDQPAGPRTLYTPPVPTPLPGLRPKTQKIGDITYEREDAERAGASTETERSAKALVERDLRARGETRPATPDEIAERAQDLRMNLAGATQQQQLNLRREATADNYLMKDAEKFIDVKTGNYLPPLTTGREAADLMKAGKAVSVPFEFDRQVIRQSRGIWGKLDRLEEIIQRRNDFFPDVEADAFPQALAKIGVARAKAWASGQIDADAAWIQKSLAPLGASLNRFSGDSGNVAIQERISNLASIGGTPMAKKAALALSGELRQAIRENLTQYGLNPEEFLGTKTQQGGTAAPKAPREGYKWVRNPQGIRGQWPANEPLAPGYTDLK